MKRGVAATASALCPPTVFGLVCGYDAGIIPAWDLIVLSGAAIYAGWWGMTTVDNMDD
jgi:hypothetical protein